jgi:RNA polymerase sigma factor (sigma-70 family)
VTPLVRRAKTLLLEATGQPEDGEGQRTSEPDGIDRTQLEAVYRAEAPKLRRLLKRKIWIEDDRNDLVQEAFTRLAESRADAASQNPGAYLQGIVRHLLADRVRRWARARDHATVESAIGPETLGPDAAAEISQMRDRYRAAVDTLPPKTRQVYMLHRAEELEYRQIAEALGISIRTVEWHVAQAIIRISKSISIDE